MTYDEYLSNGGALSEELFDKYIDAASQKINALCYYRYTDLDVDLFPKIKYHYDRALTDFIDNMDLDLNLNNNSGIIKSESEGDYSVLYKDSYTDLYLPLKLRYHIQWLQALALLV